MYSLGSIIVKFTHELVSDIMAGRKRKNPRLIRVYSVEEISNQYDFHPNTIRSWTRKDGLRYYRKGPGGKILIREDDLNAFFDRLYEP